MADGWRPHCAPPRPKQPPGPYPTMHNTQPSTINLPKLRLSLIIFKCFQFPSPPIRHFVLKNYSWFFTNAAISCVQKLDHHLVLFWYMSFTGTVIATVVEHTPRLWVMVDLTSLGVAGSSVPPNVCVPVGLSGGDYRQLGFKTAWKRLLLECCDLSNKRRLGALAHDPGELHFRQACLALFHCKLVCLT